MTALHETNPQVTTWPGAVDRDGQEIRVGDEVSILTPAVMDGHNGVGDVVEILPGAVRVRDAGGCEVTVAAADVSVDWSDLVTGGVPGDALAALALPGLRDMVLAADPGCICDPELFTGPAGIEADQEPPQDREARIEVARQVCADCPVRRACLAYALRTRPDAGVWAGFTAAEIAAAVAAPADRPARPVRQTALCPAVSAPSVAGEVA